MDGYDVLLPVTFSTLWGLVLMAILLEALEMACWI